MEETKRRWADDEEDDWDTPDPPVSQTRVPVEAPKSHPPARQSDLAVRLEGMSPPYPLEIGNLPYQLDSPDKILPYLTSGFTAPNLTFRPFSEMPRGIAAVETSDPALAQHILSLDGSTETGRPLHIRLGFSPQRSRGPARGGRGNRRGGRGPVGNSDQPKGRPRGQTYPGIVQNLNSAYSRKEAPQTESKPEPSATSAVPQVSRPKVDPFGGAKPVDTKAKDLEFEERIKKDVTTKPQDAKTSGADSEEKPSENQVQSEDSSPTITTFKSEPQTTPQTDTSPIIPPEPTAPAEPVKDSTPQSSSLDWDFSDQQSSPMGAPRFNRGGRGSGYNTRYVRVPRPRVDRKTQETAMTPTLERQEEPEKPAEPAKPAMRKRAWTSEEDDRAVINHPAIVPEVKPVEPVIRGGRGQRGRGRR